MAIETVIVSESARISREKTKLQEPAKSRGEGG
jgi:hypothetical protein